MGKTPPITDAEWVVMDALWRRGASTAQELFEDVGSAQSWTLGTVKSLLSRLAQKDAVRFEKDGKRYVYRAAVTQNACVRDAGKQLLRRAKGAPKSPLLAFFLKESRLRTEEIAQLRELLDRLEGESDA